MKRILLFGSMFFVLYVPLNYLAVRLGYMEHRSLTSMIVGGVIASIFYAIWMHYWLRFSEKKRAAKEANKN